MNHHIHRWEHRARVVLFLFGAILLTLSLNAGYGFMNALDRFKVVGLSEDHTDGS